MNPVARRSLLALFVHLSLIPVVWAGTHAANSARVTVDTKEPTAASFLTNTLEDTAVVVNLLGADPDVPTLTYTVLGNPSHGNLAGSGASRTYTPDLHYFGTDSFTYKVNDGLLDSLTATGTITITAVNDLPVAFSTNVTTAEDTPLVVMLTGSDVESALTFSIQTAPAHGMLTGTGSSRTYTPNPNYAGLDTFTFVAQDGTANSASATGTVVVTPVNDAPTAVGKTAQTIQNSAVNIPLSGTDVEGSNLTYSVVAPPAHGSLSALSPSNTVLYTPQVGFSGGDTFTYRSYDGELNSTAATVQIDVTTLNPPLVSITNPVADRWYNAPATITIQASAQSQNVGGSITQVVFYANGAEQARGTIPPYSLNLAVGNGHIQLTVRAYDSLGSSALSSAVQVFVNAKPAVTNYGAGIWEDGGADTPLLAGDPEGSNLTFTVVAGPTNGWLSGSGNVRTYRPNTNFPYANALGYDSFTWRCTDGMATSEVATVTINVSNVNDNPVAASDTASTAPDTAVAIAVLANDADVDGDALSVQTAGTPSHGTAIPQGAGILYTPDSGYTGPDSFSYTISDGHGGTASAQVAVTVTVPGFVQWSTNVATVYENAGAVAVVATRTGSSAGAASVQYGVSNGSALAGSDYVGTNAQGTLSWAAGDGGAKTVLVAVVNDTLPEENETFTVNLFNATGVGLGAWAQQTVTILASDFQYFSDTQSAVGYANKDWSFMTAWNLSSGAFLVGPDWYNGNSTFSYTLTYQQWIALFLYDDGTAQTRELRWSFRQPHVQ